MRTVFVDTGGQFALLVKQDRNHRRARSILKRLEKQGVALIMTDYVFDEFLTLLSKRTDKATAVAYAKASIDSAIQLLFIGSADFYAGKQWFERYQDKDWSFTDCVSFAVMERLGITEVFTFDHHFAQAGFRQVK